MSGSTLSNSCTPSCSAINCSRPCPAPARSPKLPTASPTKKTSSFRCASSCSAPLLQAILSDQPVVLLIDEIDRADAEFEAFLLEVLSDFQVSVPELGTLVANHRPIVVLTSNNTRELSEALKRRCLYLFIGYPSLEQELNVVRLKVPDLAPQMARQAVELVHSLRQLDLRKLPSISETLDWAQALVTLNTENLDRKTLETTLSVLLKHETDLRKVQRQLGRMDGNDGNDDDDDETDWDDELRQQRRID